MALCNITQSLLHVKHGGDLSQIKKTADDLFDWAGDHIQIASMTLTIKLDRNWNSFQPTNSAPPLTVTDSAIAPSARMPVNCEARLHAYAQKLIFPQTSHGITLSRCARLRAVSDEYCARWSPLIFW